MMMGHSVLQKLLSQIRSPISGWYSFIADDATDINTKEQLNLSIRYLENVVRKDPIGLFSLPNMFAEMVYSVLKDLLLCCNLSMKLCRGQAYDGASVMQG